MGKREMENVANLLVFLLFLCVFERSKTQPTSDENQLLGSWRTGVEREQEQSFMILLTNKVEILSEQLTSLRNDKLIHERVLNSLQMKSRTLEENIKILRQENSLQRQELAGLKQSAAAQAEQLALKYEMIREEFKLQAQAGLSNKTAEEHACINITKEMEILREENLAQEEQIRALKQQQIGMIDELRRTKESCGCTPNETDFSDLRQIQQSFEKYQREHERLGQDVYEAKRFVNETINMRESISSIESKIAVIDVNINETILTNLTLHRLLSQNERLIASVVSDSLAQEMEINSLKSANKTFQRQIAQNQESIALLKTENAAQELKIDSLKTANVTLQRQVVQNQQSITSITSANTAQQAEINSLMTVNVTLQRQVVQSINASIQSHLMNMSTGSSHGGVAFVRWGRKVCSGNSTKIYSGYVAGSRHNKRGGGSNYICLPDSPQWGSFKQDDQPGSSNIHGVEYEMSQLDSPFSLSNNGGIELTNNNAPCVLCHSLQRSTIVTIPARRDCPSNWTMEYRGYLVTEGESNYRMDFVCLDEAPEAIFGSHRNEEEALFHPVEASCGSLPCGVYETGREISCVVCSR